MCLHRAALGHRFKTVTQDQSQSESSANTNLSRVRKRETLLERKITYALVGLLAENLSVQHVFVCVPCTFVL